MKTLETITKQYKSDALDGRDLSRLVKYLTEEQANSLGVQFKDEFKGKHAAEPMTREAVLADLKDDLAFAFEKALNKRGLSASMMHDVIQMWNWILEEGLEDRKFWEQRYAQYGLPLFKATALKYGFENPIGEDRGDEDKYASD